ncbi:MAG: hypothetical protein Phyf2KO_11280 [Phycisphaerales bacterium]
MDGNEPIVLVVDNDPGVVEAISARLEGLGIATLRAGTGMQALSLLEKNSVDLVITDVNMPAGDGIELLSRVRSIDRTHCVIITGAEIDSAIQEHVDNGCSLYRKPFSAMDLVNEVVSILDKQVLLKEPVNTSQNTLGQ